MKKVAVFTGNRAEFGLQTPLLHELKKSNNFDLILIAAASHIDPDFGSTIKEIEESGFEIKYKIDFRHNSDDLHENPKTISEGINLISEVLKKINPDVFIVYADRYEGFAAVIASTQMGILTAHIEGGDVTEGGTFDDSVRHAMTKLSHLHFTTNKEAYSRIIQLGENPTNVFEVGLSSVDLIHNKEYTDKENIIKNYKLEDIENLIVFTQHPVPINRDKISQEFSEIESAFSALDINKLKIICTYPNSDVGGKEIINILSRWKEQYNFIDIYESLGRKDFHGLLDLNNSSQIKSCYIGNSSAGIKETPALRCPALILGDRQNGRLHSTNVIFSEIEKNKIISNINNIFLDNEKFNSLRECENPYGDGKMGKKVVNILSETELTKDLLTKKFFDIN